MYAVRAEAVRAEARSSWAAYARHAAGYDTLRPLSRIGVNDMGGVAVTAVDSLDTLLLMNLTSEYKAARLMVSRIDFRRSGNVNLFETTIRCLGGLLSAYALSGGRDKMLLQQAQTLGTRLQVAFQPHALPHSDVNLRLLRTNPLGNSLAEAATLSMEFHALARASGNAQFSSGPDGVRAILRRAAERCGSLLPLSVGRDPGSGHCPRGIVGLGARGDSYYEYLAKEYALEGSRLEDSKLAFARALLEIEEQMLVPYGNHSSGRLLVCELPHPPTRLERAVDTLSKLFWQRPARSPEGRDAPALSLASGKQCIAKMDHLVCFLPATIVIALHHNIVPRGRSHLRVASRIMETCMDMYGLSPSGLAPEIVKLGPAPGGAAQSGSRPWDAGSHGRGQRLIVEPRDRHCLLRPEAAESLYFMWLYTRKPKYRKAGWKMFLAFQKHARQPDGSYASVNNIFAQPLVFRDEMPSWWLAETLKYLYLLFSPADLLPMDKWVFNTEAHPLPRAPAAPRERVRFAR